MIRHKLKRIKQIWEQTPALRDFVLMMLLGVFLLWFSVVFSAERFLEKYDTDLAHLLLTYISIAAIIFSLRRLRELKDEKLRLRSAEKRIQSGQSQLQAVLDGVPDIILQVDTNMRIRWANKAALERNPNAIGYRAHQAFSYAQGAFLDSYCNWAMELRQIKKGITYQPYIYDTDDLSYWEGIGVPLTEKSGTVYGAIAIARDITQRMRVEHTWNLLTSIVESTNDAIFGVSWQGTVLSWNQGAEETYGYTADEIVGKSIIMLAPFEKRKALLETIEKVSKKEQIESHQTQMIRKGGKKIFISQTICPFVDATGKKIGVSLIDRDITESVRSENALKESEARFKGLFTHMNSGVTVFEAVGGGEDFAIKNINKSVRKIENIPNEQILNKKISELYPAIGLEKLIDVIRRVWESGEPEDILLTIQKDGKIVSWRNNNVYKLPSGEVVNIYDDVTEKHIAEEAVIKSERRFRTLVTTAPDGILLANAEGKIIELNEACASMFGFSRNDLLGGQIPHFETAEGKNKNKIRLMELARDKNRLFPKELMIRKSSGEKVPVEMAMEVLTDEMEVLTGIIAVIRDITERKKFENELKKSREELRNRAIHLESAREEERKRIAFEIHDELGYALTAIRLDVSWLSQKMTPEQKQLEERFHAMEDLIETTIKKVRTISTKLRPSVLDHFGIVAAIEWQANEFQRRTGIRCILSVNPKDIKMNDDHSTAIFRIFQETLTNAARHSKASRIDVTLRADEHELLLQVQDNGIGISQERKTNKKSFGLLGIRERANFMGGEVDIASKPGEGTSIILKVPLNNKEDEND